MQRSSRYRLRRWYDTYLLLFRSHGSVYPRALIMCSISTLLCWIFWEYVVPQTPTLISNPTVYGFFLQTAGLILAFATNICYTRFWDGLTSLTSMSQSLMHVASMVIAFDQDYDPPKLDPPCCNFHAKMLHQISILHAVCIQALLISESPNDRVSLEILGGMTPQEADELAQSPDQPNLAMHWLNMAMSKRALNGGLRMPPPIVAQVWAQLNSAMSAFAAARKCAENRVPISLQQSLAWADIIVLIFTPLCIACFVPDLAAALCMSFVTAGIFHAIYLADIAMQQPFGKKTNDLPLKEVHGDFVRRMLSLIEVEVAEELSEMSHLNREEFSNFQVVDCVSAKCCSTNKEERTPLSRAGSKGVFYSSPQFSEPKLVATDCDLP